MQWINTFMDKFYAFVEKLRPFFSAMGRFFHTLGEALYKVGLYMYRLRSLILAAPVAGVALILASESRARLAETVEITSFTFNTEASDALFGFLELGSTTISQDAAVLGPLMITTACLIMMICSKRTLYPFLISVFTLCLPPVIWFFNTYPM